MSEGPSADARATMNSSSGVYSNDQNGADRYFFGLKANGFCSQQDLSDDYEQRFPADPVYEETGSNARVWRTYLAESGEFDQNMVGEARDGLDAMLVFAGLFSAVVTSFLVQTSENLQVDYSEMAASLLSELISIQRASAAGEPVNSVPPSALNLTATFTPDSLDVWVNGLWAVSLSLGLIVALAALLVKQWLHRYIALRSGTPKDRSHVRHSRYMGFRKWKVLGIIGCLPVIMHLSLAFFFFGLVLFFRPLHLVLSSIIGVLMLALYVLYLVTNILPALFLECPYQTPLSDFIVDLLRRNIALSLRTADEKAETSRDSLSVEALRWLYNVSSNASVHSVVLQAIGGFPAIASKELRKAFDGEDTLKVIERLLLKCTSYTDNFRVRQAKPGMETVAERLSRASLIYDAWDGAARRWQTIWGVSFPTGFIDPRFKAASLVVDNMAMFTSEYRPFILSHHNAQLHSLVWISLVRKAIGTNVFFDYRTNPVLFRILFPALWAEHIPKPGNIPLLSMSPEDASASHPPLVTMAHTIRDHMREEFCEHLLTLFSGDDRGRGRQSTYPSSKAFEALMNTMEFSLYHVSANPFDFENECWEVISEALSHYGDDYHYPILEEQRWFFEDLVARIIQQTDICGSHPHGSERFFKLREIVLRVYGSTKERCVYRSSSTLPNDNLMSVTARNSDNEWIPSHSVQFTLLRRAIEGPLRDIPHTVGPMRPYAAVILKILERALRHGRTEAYQLAIENNCLELVCKFSANLATPIVSAAVTGLISDMAMADGRAAREMFIDYLFEPQNLRIAVISLTHLRFTLPHPGGPQTAELKATVQDLASLRPDKSTWDDCRHWLSLVSEWARGEKRLQDHKELALGTEWMLDNLLKHIRGDALETAIRSLDVFFDSESQAPTPSIPAPIFAASPLVRERRDSRQISAQMPKTPHWRERTGEASSELIFEAV